MATVKWIGDAIARPNIWQVSLGGITEGTTVALTIGRKTISLESTGDGEADALAFVELISETTIPEWMEVTATSASAVLTLTGPDLDRGDMAGKPIEVSGQCPSLDIRVARAVVGDPGRDEVQRVSLAAGLSGGTFTLSFRGVVSGAIAYDASAATVQAALEALASIGEGGVAVSGIAGGPWDVTFQETLGKQNVELMVGNGGNLTGISYAAGAYLTQARAVGASAVYGLGISDTGAGEAMFLFNGETTDSFDYSPKPSAEEIQSLLESHSAIEVGDVSVVLMSDLANDPFYYQWANAYDYVIFFGGNWASKTIAQFELVAGEYTNIPGNYWIRVENLIAHNYMLTFYFVKSDKTLVTFSYAPWNPYTQGEHEWLYGLRDYMKQQLGVGRTQVGFTNVSSNVQSTPKTISFTLMLSLGENYSEGNWWQDEDHYVPSMYSSRNAPFHIKYQGSTQEVDWAKLVIPVAETGYANLGTITAGVTATDQINEILIRGTPSGGTFTVTLYDAASNVWINPEETEPIPYNATAAEVQTALTDLEYTIAGTITVSGPPGGPWFVTFRNASQAIGVAADGALLSGGAVVVSTITESRANRNEIQTARVIGGAATGGSWTLAYGAQTTSPIPWNATALQVKTALEALTAIGTNNVSVTASTGLWSITFVGDLANTPLPFVLVADASNLTGQSALIVTETDAGTSPHHFNEAKNWDTLALPVTGDTIIFEDGASDCLYGLANSTITPASLQVRASYTGKIGLGTYDADGGYYQYRDTMLQLGDDDDNATMSIVIGEGEGGGSGRIRLDTGDCQVAMRVQRTAEPADTDMPALTWIGTHADNEITVNRGTVGIAYLAKETAVVSTLNVGSVEDPDGDATVTCGAGATVGTIAKTGGTLTLLGSTTITLFTHWGGVSEIGGAHAVSQLTVRGGTVYYVSTGTLGGNTIVSGPGKLDFSRDLRDKTVTNPIDVYGDEADVVDPNKVISSLIVDYNETSRFEGLGRHVRITRGSVS